MFMERFKKMRRFFPLKALEAHKFLLALLLMILSAPASQACLWYIYDLEGNLVIDGYQDGLNETRWTAYENAIPNNIRSPYCDYTFYSDAECTIPITRWERLTETKVYAKYTVKASISHLFDLTSGKDVTLRVGADTNGWYYYDDNGTLKFTKDETDISKDAYLWNLSVKQTGGVIDPYHVNVVNKVSGKHVAPADPSHSTAYYSDAAVDYAIIGTFNLDLTGDDHLERYSLVNITKASDGNYYYLSENNRDYIRNYSGVLFPYGQKDNHSRGWVKLAERVTTYDVVYHVRINNWENFITADQLDAEGDERTYTMEGVNVGTMINTMPAELERYGTKNVVLRESYDGDPITDTYLTASMDTDGDGRVNIYITYDIDTEKLYGFFTFKGESDKWNLLYQTNNNNANYFQLLHGTTLSVTNSRVGADEDNLAHDDVHQWKFTGTPYTMTVTNRAMGEDVHLCVATQEQRSTLVLSSDRAAYPFDVWALITSADGEGFAIRSKASQLVTDFNPNASGAETYLWTGAKRVMYVPLTEITYHIRVYDWDTYLSDDQLTDDGDEMVYTWMRDVRKPANTDLPADAKPYGIKNMVFRNKYLRDGGTIFADDVHMGEIEPDEAGMRHIYVNYEIDFDLLGDHLFSNPAETHWWLIYQELGTNSYQQMRYDGDGSATTAVGTAQIAHQDNPPLLHEPKYQWCLFGTPYNVRIINRTTPHTLYMATDQNTLSRPLVVTDDFDTYPYTSMRLMPAQSGEGFALRVNGTDYSIDLNAGAKLYTGNRQILLERAAESSTIIYKVYDPEGNLTCEESDDVDNGTVLTGETLTGNITRKYCRYTLYTSEEMTTPVEEYTVGGNATLYIKWSYSDDAIVFNTGANADDYQYYMLSQTNSQYSYNIGLDEDGNPSYVSFNAHDTHAHWALVGNPYEFRLYNRTGKFVNHDRSLVDDASQADTWSAFNHSETEKNLDIKATDHSADFFASYGSYITYVSRIVVPVYIFRSGDTRTAIDSDEYIFDYPDNAVESRITEDMLTDGAYGNTAFHHAFCNYKFYYTWDAATGALSNSIPTSGPFAGLPYCGGDEQYPRAFYGTYTVDTKRFTMPYLLGPSSVYIVLDEEPHATSNYWMNYLNRSERATAINTINAHWELAGDPYDLTIRNLSLGEDSENWHLGCYYTTTDGEAKGQTGVNEDNGRRLLLTNDEAYQEYLNANNPGGDLYGKYTRFEVIENHDGTYSFYLIPCEGQDVERYGCTLAWHHNGVLFVRNDLARGEGRMVLEPTVQEYALTWKVVDPDGNEIPGVSHIEEFVPSGTPINVDEMPESLIRHYCNYVAVLDENKDVLPDDYTMPERDITVYVKYEYTFSAPVFYNSVDEVNSESEFYRVRMLNGGARHYLYDDLAGAVAVTDDRTHHNAEWALIGNPYSFSLYERHTGNYIYLPEDKTLPGTTITVDASQSTQWTLLDDASGDHAVICLNDGMNLVYVDFDGSVAICPDNTTATRADFINGKGVDGMKMILHFGANTLRADTAAVEIALESYYLQGQSLTECMPTNWRRPFLDYTFDYNGTAVSEVTQDMVVASNRGDEIVLNVTYATAATAPFAWSDLTTGDMHYYYMQNCNGTLLNVDAVGNMRTDGAYSTSEPYPTSYEWAVVGDPYGFKMLTRYDPDVTLDRTFSVSDATLGNFNTLVVAEQSEKNIFEMRTGSRSGSFWMHPIYTEALRDEVISDMSTNSSYSVGSVPVLEHQALSHARRSSIACYRLLPLNELALADIVNYTGYVGGLTAQAFEALDEDIKAAIAAGEELTAEQRTRLHDYVLTPGNRVEMTGGYYRIIPYVYEKGTSGMTQQRVYLRGFIYGEGIGNEWRELGNPYRNAMQLNERATAAASDPSSIFHFKPAGGVNRYYITTQGCGIYNSGMEEGEGQECRYEQIGDFYAQIRTGHVDPDVNRDYAYISYRQNFSNSQREDFRLLDLRGSFCNNNEGFTRMLLQPVGDAVGQLPLTLTLTTSEGHDYSYSSLYVPYDVTLPEGVKAFTCTGESFTGGVYLLKMNEVEGNVLPAGTPALLRAASTVTEVTLTIPGDMPSEPLAGNTLQGSYLYKVLNSVSVSGTVYSFGYSSKLDSYGFYRNNTPVRDYDGNIVQAATNRTVKNNRAYFVRPDAVDGNQVQSFMLAFTDGNGESSVLDIRRDNTTGEELIFDLMGRRVLTPQPGHIYIVGGKKVLF